MKFVVSLTALAMIAGCVSNAEYDQDRAYAKCDSISDESSRNRCIADALQDAARERHEQAERQEQFDENAERRELGREIAGARDD